MVSPLPRKPSPSMLPSLGVAGASQRTMSSPIWVKNLLSEIAHRSPGDTSQATQDRGPAHWGRISPLKGEPPVQRGANFRPSIRLRTAKTFGLNVPPTLPAVPTRSLSRGAWPCLLGVKGCPHQPALTASIRVCCTSDSRHASGGRAELRSVPGSEVAFPRVFLADCPKAEGVWLIGPLYEQPRRRLC